MNRNKSSLSDGEVPTDAKEQGIKPSSNYMA